MLRETEIQMISRYCTMDGCEGGDKCLNKYRCDGEPCTMEYVAAPEGTPQAQFNWLGDDPPPRRWWVNGTLVYRSYSDYCD